MAAPEREQQLSLADAVTHLLEECRMVLPGVQALFGFQLIAVFNNGFAEKLSATEQKLHFLALALVAIAVALIMTPAAYHRQTGPRIASEHFLAIGGRLLLASMFPLVAGIGLDFFVIARVILGSRAWATVASLGLVLCFIACWFAIPRLARRR